MAGSSFEYRRNYLTVDLHDCSITDARWNIPRVVDNAYKYGISYVEFVHGSPDHNKVSLRDVVQEFADNSKHFVRSRSFIDGGFMEYDGDYPSCATSTRYRLMENPHPDAQDADMQLTDLEAKYSASKEHLGAWFPMKFLMSHTFRPKDAINFDMTVYTDGTIRNGYYSLADNISEEKILAAVRQVVPDAILVNPQVTEPPLIKFLTREQFNCVSVLIRDSLIKPSSLPIMEVAKEFGQGEVRFLWQWKHCRSRYSSKDVVCLKEFTSNGSWTHVEYVPIELIAAVAADSGLRYPRQATEAPLEQTLKSISAGVVSFFSKLFGK